MSNTTLNVVSIKITKRNKTALKEWLNDENETGLFTYLKRDKKRIDLYFHNFDSEYPNKKEYLLAMSSIFKASITITTINECNPKNIRSSEMSTFNQGDEYITTKKDYLLSQEYEWPLYVKSAFEDFVNIDFI